MAHAGQIVLRLCAKLLQPLLGIQRHPVLFISALLLVNGVWLAFGEEILDQYDICTTQGDEFFGNAQRYFSTLEWISRGLCVRQSNNDDRCYRTLDHILKDGLNEIRKSEYAGAAGVMALLPTIGALLGAPTNEIWRLMTMVPFGGVLATAMSFGGAILPRSVKDYESDFMKQEINTSRPQGPGRTDSNTPFIDNPSPGDTAMMKRGRRLMHQVEKRLRPTEYKPIPTKYIWSGLIGMIILLAGSHVAMGIVEQGAILPWWCLSRWWIHMWYGMG